MIRSSREIFPGPRRRSPAKSRRIEGRILHDGRDSVRAAAAFRTRPAISPTGNHHAFRSCNFTVCGCAGKAPCPDAPCGNLPGRTGLPGGRGVRQGGALVVPRRRCSDGRSIAAGRWAGPAGARRTAACMRLSPRPDRPIPFSFIALLRARRCEHLPACGRRNSAKPDGPARRDAAVRRSMRAMRPTGRTGCRLAPREEKRGKPCCRAVR